MFVVAEPPIAEDSPHATPTHTQKFTLLIHRFLHTRNSQVFIPLVECMDHSANDISYQRNQSWPQPTNFPRMYVQTLWTVLLDIPVAYTFLAAMLLLCRQTVISLPLKDSSYTCFLFLYWDVNVTHLHGFFDTLCRSWSSLEVFSFFPSTPSLDNPSKAVKTCRIRVGANSIIAHTR